MRIRSVTFGFTKNLGNYQSARADCTVEVREGEGESWEVDDAWLLAAAQVKEALGEDLSDDERRVYQQFLSGAYIP